MRDKHDEDNGGAGYGSTTLPFPSLFGGDDSDDDAWSDDSDGGEGPPGGGPADVDGAMHSDDPVRDRVDESDLTAVAGRIGAPLPILPLPRDVDEGGDASGDNDPAAAAAAAETATAAAAVTELEYRADLVAGHMGSMAQCRGSNGDRLRDAGAIDAALRALWGLNHREGNDGVGCCSCCRLGSPEGRSCGCGDAEPPADRSRAGGCRCGKAESSSADRRRAGGSSAVRLPLIDGAGASSQESGREHERHRSCDWTPVDRAAVALATACLGAIRDMVCGNASNRGAVTDFSTCGCKNNTCRSSGSSSIGGVAILASYVSRYRGLAWEEILALPGGDEVVGDPNNSEYTARGRQELRLFSNAAGAIRNATHSTPATCSELHALNVTDMFIHKLKHGSRDADESEPPCLPDASRPWREACFRTAGALINMAEKNTDCAQVCGADIVLVRLLVEAWGGTGGGGKFSTKKKSPASTPMLHLGLAAILHAANDHRTGGGEEGLDEELRAILEKEEARKKFAQRREEERKARKKGG